MNDQRCQHLIANVMDTVSCVRDPQLDDAFHRRFPTFQGYITGMGDSFLNAIWGSQTSVEDCYETVLDVLDFFNEVDLPFCWWTTPFTQPPNFPLQLMGHGFDVEPEMQGCCLDLTADRPPLQMPDGLEVRRVADDSMFDEWASIFLAGFHFGPSGTELCKRWRAHGFGEDVPYQRYLGYFNGKPIATGSLLFSEGIVGFYDDAVLSDVRGKGIGTAMMEWRIHMLKSQGHSVASAIMTMNSMARGIYERAGFARACLLTPAQYR